MTARPDHRRLGRELDLFDTDPLMGAGLPYWLPDGAAVRHALEEYVRDAERRAGYQHVYSPVLGKRELYEISGHWSHYSEDMFPPDGTRRRAGGAAPEPVPPPRAHLPLPPPQLPRTPAPHRRVGRHVPLRAVRCPRRPHPRTGHPAQRRAPLVRPWSRSPKRRRRHWG